MNSETAPATADTSALARTPVTLGVVIVIVVAVLGLGGGVAAFLNAQDNDTAKELGQLRGEVGKLREETGSEFTKVRAEVSAVREQLGRMDAKLDALLSRKP